MPRVERVGPETPMDAADEFEHQLMLSEAAFLVRRFAANEDRRVVFVLASYPCEVEHGNAHCVTNLNGDAVGLAIVREYIASLDLERRTAKGRA